MKVHTLQVIKTWNHDLSFKKTPKAWKVTSLWALKRSPPSMWTKDSMNPFCYVCYIMSALCVMSFIEGLFLKGVLWHWMTRSALFLIYFENWRTLVAACFSLAFLLLSFDFGFIDKFYQWHIMSSLSGKLGSPEKGCWVSLRSFVRIIPKKPKHHIRSVFNQLIVSSSSSSKPGVPPGDF